MKKPENDYHDQIDPDHQTKKRKVMESIIKFGVGPITEKELPTALQKRNAHFL